MLEYELDIVQKELDLGNKVIFLYCRGNQVVCYANNSQLKKSFKRRICWECKSRVFKGVSWLSESNNNFVALPFEYHEKISCAEGLDNILRGCPKNIASLRSLVDIDGVDIFDAALSTLISETRESEPDLDIYWVRLTNLIELSRDAYFIAKQIFSTFNPDRVYVFNGRIARYRPVMRLAQQQGLELFVYEYPWSNFKNYTLTEGGYPHDMKNISKRLSNNLSSLNVDFSTIEIEAKKWFEGRRNNIRNGIQQVILSKKLSSMNVNHAPDFWDASKFNLVFFVSSQDEFLSIKENVESIPFGQEECLRHVAENFPNVNIIVRVHPILDGIDKRFIESIQSLRKFHNIVIINASESISSYWLASYADLILCYGSSMGVESAYIKKPVVVVGVSPYIEFNCALHVATKRDLLRALKKSINGDYSSFPSSNEMYMGACKYAFAFIKEGITPKYMTRVSFDYGCMVRSGIKTHLRPNFLIFIVNRIFNIPENFMNGVNIFLNQKSQRSNFYKNPLSKIYRTLFH